MLITTTPNLEGMRIVCYLNIVYGEVIMATDVGQDFMAGFSNFFGGRSGTYEEALAEALRVGRIAGASLDVMTPEPLPENDPLWSCPKLLLTPHISGNMSLGLTCRLAVEMFCADLARYAAGEALKNQVDRRIGY